MAQSREAADNYLSNYFSLMNNLGDPLFDIDEKQLFKESILESYYKEGQTLLANNINPKGSVAYKGREYLENVMLIKEGITFNYSLLEIGELKRTKKLKLVVDIKITSRHKQISSGTFAIIIEVMSQSRDLIIGRVLSIDRTEKPAVDSEEQPINSSERGAWNNARSSNNPDLIEMFITRYPKSEFKNEALRMLSSMRKGSLPPLIRVLESDMVLMERGTVILGCKEGLDDCRDDEKPHLVKNIEPFWISKFEITQKLYAQVMHVNPSYFDDGSPSAPVENVSWDDVQEFIQTLNGLSGNPYKFRLPTEAEWEYAAGGGDSEIYSGGSIINEVAVYRKNSNSGTADVGTKMPNQYGLYDMTGNVSEWCQNNYGPFSSNFTSSNPEKIIKGGSWNDKQKGCRVNNREKAVPDYLHETIGFRLARNF